jgi:hypothetical protein
LDKQEVRRKKASRSRCKEAFGRKQDKYTWREELIFMDEIVTYKYQQSGTTKRNYYFMVTYWFERCYGPSRGQLVAASVRTQNKIFTGRCSLTSGQTSFGELRSCCSENSHMLSVLILPASEAYATSVV